MSKESIFLSTTTDSDFLPSDSSPTETTKTCTLGVEPTEADVTTIVDSDPMEVVRPKVAGWLLCIKGPSVGMSYEVYFGRNSVGRGVDDRVCVDADPTISRCQIYIIYDAEENEYAITPGKGTAITRLNGKRLDYAAELHHGACISLSKETVLRFVPACDNLFRWVQPES